MTHSTPVAATAASKARHARGATWQERLAAVPTWEKVSLALVMLVAAVLNLYQLTNNGLGNLYYATAVKSMLTSWHNFFFVSFDPGGFVTVDKPPLGLWIQAASAKIFGFSSLSLLLPEALAGIIAVGLLYYLVRRTFGAPAGLLAGLALAVTPVSVIASRDNILDSLLVLGVLLAAWAALRAAETADLRWLIASAVLVGAAFNMKTLEAYLVVPALGLVYLLAAPVRWRTRLLHLAIAGAVLLVVSLSWSVVVDLTPASQRPYVGSSQTNSEINLALGYNGWERITGLFGGHTSSGTTSSADQLTAGGFFANENGDVGIQRLFNPTLGNQVSWLLPLALVGLLSSIWQVWSSSWRQRTRQAQARATWQVFVSIRLTPPQQQFVLWTTWLVTMGIFFSIASFFHSYYLNILAPAVCALAAVGLVGLWRDYQRAGWQGWLLPVALLATAAEQWHILAGYATWDTGLSAIVVLGTVVIAAFLLLTRWGRQTQAPAQLKTWVAQSDTAWSGLNVSAFSLGGVVLGVGMVVLLLTPTIWSYRSRGNAGLVPAAGPDNGMGVMTGQSRASALPSAASGANQSRSQTTADPKLVSYLRQHRGNAAYLVATTNATSAEPLILSTGQPVMAIGGFLGSDKILTLSQFQHAVKAGTVRYFLSDGIGMPGELTATEIDELPQEIQEIIKAMGGAEGGATNAATLDANAKISSWVSSTCKTVPQSDWSSTTTTSGGTSTGGATPPTTGGDYPAFPGGADGEFPGGEFPGDGFPGGEFPGGTGGTSPGATDSGVSSGFGGVSQVLYDCA